jgi:hypothetical protein
LPALLENRPDSFYEMPRFDIPESVWSSLQRSNPRDNMKTLHDWLVANKAAVVEAAPDHRMQPYCLFHAPGDFQLAPRSFFMRLRGFDESMNKRFHSDETWPKNVAAQRTEDRPPVGGLVGSAPDHYRAANGARARPPLSTTTITGRCFISTR